MKDPKIIVELKRIAAANKGILLPQKVVQAAKSKTSVLHGEFTWDDNTAAQEYRLWQARSLINVCVEYIGTNGDEREMRVFVSLRKDRDEGGYRLLEKVVSSKTFRAQLLEDALAEMTFFRDKYKDLKELAEVFEAIDRLSKK
jgi:UDP-2,3-diacylglucosamine pyrophosphatase LpxH